jgi:hypothetical protein
MKNSDRNAIEKSMKRGKSKDEKDGKGTKIEGEAEGNSWERGKGEGAILCRTWNTSPVH